MTHTLRYPSLTLLSAALLALGGCSSSSDSETPPEGGSGHELQSFTIDASDYDSFAYFNLERGETVTLTDEEAAESTDWHIGFRRNRVMINGGDSGAGNVSAALAVAQDDFYTESGEADANVFLNATADSELEHLEASVDTEALSYEQDMNLPAIMGSGEMTGTVIDMGWYNYDVTTHTLSVNGQNTWILRSAEGDSHAQFYATAVDYSGATGLSARFDLMVEAAGTQGFVTPATFSADIPPAGGEACFDFDINALADCSSTTWDVKLRVAGRDINLWLNGGVSGEGQAAAFGSIPMESLDNYDESADLPANHFAQDASGGLFLDSGWYAYNLSGGHKLWPNYRVYVINSDESDENAAQYKLQITSYYSDAGDSGHPNIRYQLVTD